MSKAASHREERLQKLLARAGYASRRKVEELIAEGRVTINGKLAELGDKADPERDAVKVDGKRIQLAAVEHLYLVLNKPKGVMSTVADPEGRRTVLELVPRAMRKGLVPVGRLDFATEGLLLLTTDGEFAHHVAHPRYGCAKVYEVKVAGFPEDGALDRLRGGIVLEGKRTSPCRIEPRRTSGSKESKENSWWDVELTEGRTRQIREMFARIGHPVQKLRRVAIGSLSDPALPVGALRELTAKEVERLLRSTHTAKPKPAAGTILPRRRAAASEVEGRKTRPARRPAAGTTSSSPKAANEGRQAPSRSPAGAPPRRAGGTTSSERTGARPPGSRPQASRPEGARSQGQRPQGAGASKRRPGASRPEASRPNRDRPGGRGPRRSH